MNRYESVLAELQASPKVWLISGVAGFIGSNLLEALLRLDQKVVGLDNFSTGFARNLDEVRDSVRRNQWERFTFFEGDIRSREDCQRACAGVDHVLHQAALGSVPRSIADPLATNEANVTGFLNMLIAARDASVSSFTYAASSSTYGDHEALPKREDIIGRPLSPYAVTKYVNELYAEVFARCYGFSSVGLRYFNVFGRRQNPDGAYAAVIPQWIGSMLNGNPVYINGDGETSRDFTYIENVVQANILCALAKPEARNQVYNVAVGDQTTLTSLYAEIREALAIRGVDAAPPVYRDFRAGDVRHSRADIFKARTLLGYSPTHDFRTGLRDAVNWYVDHATG